MTLLVLVDLVASVGCRPPAQTPAGAVVTARDGAPDPACVAFLTAPTPDSETFTVNAQVYTAAGADLPAAYAQLLGEGLREELRVPQPLALDTYDQASLEPKLPRVLPRVIPPGTTLTASLRGDYEARLFPDGHLRDGRVIGGDAVPALDTVVLAAFRGLDTSGEVPPPPDTLHVGADGLLLRIIVAPRLATDVTTRPAATLKDRFLTATAAASPAGQTTVPADSLAETPLFTIRLPQFVVRQLAKPTAPWGVPRYPDELRHRHVNGEVLLRFIVAPPGVVDFRTVEVLKSTDVRFTRAVLDALPEQRFRPLVIGPACPVRAAIEMPFVFTVN